MIGKAGTLGVFCAHFAHQPSKRLHPATTTAIIVTNDLNERRLGATRGKRKDCRSDCTICARGRAANGQQRASQRALPICRMEALHRRARLSCRVDDHYYSVPFGLLRETVEARFTDGTIEVFHKGERIASHMRLGIAHKQTTIPQHTPSGVGVMRNGRRHGCCARPRRSAPPRSRCSRRS
jgi:hypothetical protein